MLKKRYKAPVTIIVAFKCKDGIAIACDSRTSDPQNGLKRDDTQKLHVVTCKDGNKGNNRRSR